MKDFIKNQIFSIKKNGLKIIPHKIYVLMTLVIFLIPMLITLLIFRAISSIVLIRLAPLNFSRIGGLYDQYWYLRLKKAGVFNKESKFIDLFFIDNNFKANKIWVRLWRRSINIIPFSFFFKRLYSLNKFLFPDCKKFEVPQLQGIFHNFYLSKKNELIKKFKNEEIEKVNNVISEYISFNNKEDYKGNRYLEELGIKKFNYVCFHSRDKAYLNVYDKNMNWDYHNYRDSKISNYLKAMEKVANNNLFCLRMGSVVEERIKSKNKKIIDYANSKFQSDFLDIYLPSKCLFALYSESGISAIPEAFNRPVVYVNWSSQAAISSYNPNSLFIPKKFYSLKKKRNLTFREIINSELGRPHSTEDFKKKDVIVIENTPDEIYEVTLEMIKRINNKWTDTPEENKMQKKFWDLFDYSFIKPTSFKIGSDFLKKNFELLN